MLGAIVLAVIIVVLIPVGVIMSGALAAGLLGWALKSDGDARYEGSELIDLNR
jgi:hypothetical protein